MSKGSSHSTPGAPARKFGINQSDPQVALLTLVTNWQWNEAVSQNPKVNQERIIQKEKREAESKSKPGVKNGEIHGRQEIQKAWQKVESKKAKRPLSDLSRLLELICIRLLKPLRSSVYTGCYDNHRWDTEEPHLYGDPGSTAWLFLQRLLDAASLHVLPDGVIGPWDMVYNKGQHCWYVSNPIIPVRTSCDHFCTCSYMNTNTGHPDRKWSSCQATWTNTPSRLL